MIKKTIAIIGKSTLPATSPAYKFSKKLAYELTTHGFYLRHGGYAGGIMQAVSEGASCAIKEGNLSPHLNVGVPEVRFDTDYKRVANSKFLKASKNITERLNNLILKSDCLIVSPRGGDGTMLELQLAIHENMLGEYTGIIRPIIICELPGETQWRKILNSQLSLLDNNVSNINNCPWMHTVHSVKDVLEIIVK